MSTYQLGFIGTGNMGGALAQAAAKSGAGMLLSNRTADKAVLLAAELGCAAGTNLEVAEGCKYIFLGVKPQMLQALLAELKAPLSARTDRPVLVSMAASVTIRRIHFFMLREDCGFVICATFYFTAQRYVKSFVLCNT